MTTDQIIEAKKAERKAAGLFVRIATDDGLGFDYYPASLAQKASYIAKCLKNNRKILEK